MPILPGDDDTNPDDNLFVEPPSQPEAPPASSRISGTLSPMIGSGQAVRTFMVALATEDGPRLLAFRTSNLLIGRMPDNHLALNHASVSRRHARLSVTPKGVTIEDLGSQNGTTINGTPVKKPETIRPGDVVRVGYVPMFYFGFIEPTTPPGMEVIDTSIVVNPSAPPV